MLTSPSSCTVGLAPEWILVVSLVSSKEGRGNTQLRALSVKILLRPGQAFVVYSWIISTNVTNVLFRGLYGTLAPIPHCQPVS